MHRALDPWMNFVLRFVAVYNVLAGLCMVVFYHECYAFIGLPKPDLVMPLQLVGLLVGLFGVGYWMVAVNPIENRNVLLLGCLSKTLGSILGIVYMAMGKLPVEKFLPVLFFADIIYIPLFALMLRRLYRLAGRKRETGA